MQGNTWNHAPRSSSVESEDSGWGATQPSEDTTTNVKIASILRFFIFITHPSWKQSLLHVSLIQMKMKFFYY